MPFGTEKLTRMVWLPDGEKFLKISLFILTECTNVTDRHTDTHHITTTKTVTYNIETSVAEASSTASSGNSYVA